MATIVTRAGKGSALTWTEGDANFTNLNNDKIEAVSEDTAPALGGNLDVDGFKIVNNNTDGNIVLETNGIGQIRAVCDGLYVGTGSAESIITSIGSQDLVLDTNDGVNSGSFRITAGANGDIEITPNGTGAVIIDGNEFPQAIGAQGEVLTADGSGLVEWKLPGAIVTQVYNADSVQINKGQPVYVFGSNGTNISVKRAVNTGDATSAQTLGLANEDIAAGATGNVVCQGVVKGVDTTGLTEGGAIYLGSTAGTYTQTKPYAPNHLVYLGFIETAGANGRIYVRTQNGYELEEIHDVNINHNVALADKHYLVYNSSNSLWENRSLDIVNDTTPQLGGNLDVNTRSIVSTSNNNITVASANDIILTIEGSANKGIKIVEADVGDPGVPDLVTSIQPAGTADSFILFATNELGFGTTTGDITLEPGAGSGNLAVVGNIVLDGDLDLVTGSVTTSTVDGDITITPNGAGVVIVDSDLDVATGAITTSTLDTDITLTPNGTGVIVLDGDVTINANTASTPVDDTAPVAWLEITANASVYYLPLYQ